jgi:hypothetical protein
VHRKNDAGHDLNLQTDANRIPKVRQGEEGLDSRIGGDDRQKERVVSNGPYDWGGKPERLLGVWTHHGLGPTDDATLNHVGLSTHQMMVENTRIEADRVTHLQMNPQRLNRGDGG